MWRPDFLSSRWVCGGVWVTTMSVPGGMSSQSRGESGNCGETGYWKALKSGGCAGLRGEEGEPKIVKVVWGPWGEMRLIVREVWMR